MILTINTNTINALKIVIIVIIIDMHLSAFNTTFILLMSSSNYSYFLLTYVTNFLATTVINSIKTTEDNMTYDSAFGNKIASVILSIIMYYIVCHKNTQKTDNIKQLSVN